MTDLAEVHWIGGGSGGGKSTIARLLGRRCGVPVLHTDDLIRAHAAALPDRPLISRFVAASIDERWLGDPAAMLDAFPWFAGEGFELLLDDIRALTPGPLIVEGFRLLPRLVAPLLEGDARAVFLLPTPQQRLAAFDGRTPAESFWTGTSDAALALRTLLERDRLFTQRVGAEAVLLGLPTLRVDGTDPVAHTADLVAAAIGLPPAR